MNSLTYQDKEDLEDLFGMHSGYVLGFVDATFANFFQRYGVEIHSPKYHTYGTSKAKKLRAFWNSESDELVGQVLSRMLVQYEAYCEREGKDIDRERLQRVRESINRMNDGPLVRNLSSEGQNVVNHGTNRKTALRELFHEIRNSPHSFVAIDDLDIIYNLGVTVAGWVVRFRSLAKPFLPPESITRLDMIEVDDIAGNLASTHKARMELESLIPVVKDLWDEDSAVDVIIPNSLQAINDTVLNEHIEKVINKIKIEDFSGVITNCYTLTEAVQKLLLLEEGVDFKETEGSIRKLHTRVAQILNLDPRSVTLNPPDHEATRLAKQTLEGLLKIVSGLYGVANRASDRHASPYKVSPHHARLVANATFSYCGFLVETREFQKAK